MRNSIYAIPIAISIFGLSLAILAYAQETTETTDTMKIYEYNCSPPNLSRYNVSIEIVGCPSYSVIVHDWDNVNAMDKIGIDAILTSNNFKDSGTQRIGITEARPISNVAKDTGVNSTIGQR